MQVDSIFKVANSIIIDGINDRIISTSGTIGFGNTNLKEINKITADSINIGNIQITGQSIFDSLQVKNNLTVGERSGTTGAYSMVVGTSAPEYGLAAPEASNLGAFAQGSGTKATGIASFSTGVNTTASGDYSFSIGRNAIASGESSFAGGQDNVGTSNCVIASGGNAFNYSSVSNPYTGVGAAAKHSAILGGKDHSIDTACSNSGIFCGKNNTILSSLTHPVMRTVIIGGENIIATEANTVYVPNLIAKGSITAENMNVTGQTVFDSLQVNNKIKIGNSVILDGTFDEETGTNHNSVYTDDSDFFIQSDYENSYPYNTILNAMLNTGNVGIGTTEPQQKLHVKYTLPTLPTEQTINAASIRLEFSYPPLIPTVNNYWDFTVDINGLYFVNPKTEKSPLSIKNNGLIGIGTTNPSTNLHIKGITDAGAGPQPDTGIVITSTVLRIEDKVINIPPSNERDVWWDMIVSGLNGKFYINKQVAGEANTTNIMTLTEDGKVGVGTTNPQRTFHVDGDILINGHEGSIYFGNEHYPEYLETGEWAIEFAPEYEGNQSGLNFWKPSGSHNLSGEDGYGNYYLFINDDGNVGIGTGTPDAKLTVNGKIKVIGDDVNGSDYVFDKDYKLMPINELAIFTDSLKHLPDVPSALEMKKNGLDLGDMTIILLKKIEENTLYIIKQNKEIEKLKKENQILKEK